MPASYRTYLLRSLIQGLMTVAQQKEKMERLGKTSVLKQIFMIFFPTRKNILPDYMCNSQIYVDFQTETIFLPHTTVWLDVSSSILALLWVILVLGVDYPCVLHVSRLYVCSSIMGNACSWSGFPVHVTCR